MTVYRATLFGVIYGVQTRNVLHFNFEGGDPNAVMVQLAGELENRWLSQQRFLSNSDMHYYNINVRVAKNNNFMPIDRPVSIDGFHSTIEGTSAIITTVFRFITAVSGRTGIGKIHVPAPRLGSIQNGRWTGLQEIDNNSVADSWEGQFTGDNPASGFNLCVTNQIEPQVAFKEVQSIVARDYPGTCARRQFFRGI